MLRSVLLLPKTVNDFSLSIQSKCEKTHTASSLADSRLFLRFAEGRNTRKQDLFEKLDLGRFRVENLGDQKWKLEKLTCKSQF